MQLYFGILFIATATALQPEGCVPFNLYFFQPTILKEGINNIQKLVLNRNDNTLYFIFNRVGENGNTLGYLNLDTNAVGVVEGIRNASSVTVDQTNNVVYAGGEQGLYTVNSRKVIEKLPIFHNIYDIFFKDVLYFTTKNREAFKVVNNVVYRLPELRGILVEKIVLDDDNNLLFITNRRLFRLRLGTKAETVPVHMLVDGITVDSDYKPYVATTKGIYVYNKYKYALDQVSNYSLRHLSAVTFSKDDKLIYEAAGNIYKLEDCPE